MERKIYLSDYKWTPDDDIPGQIKFIFNTPDIMGKASVRLYLNDGYEAPADIEETEVDMNSDEYCRMISHSLMHKKSHRKDKSRKRGNTCIHRWIYHTGSRCGTYKYRVLRIQILSAFPEAFFRKE